MQTIARLDVELREAKKALDLLETILPVLQAAVYSAELDLADGLYRT